MNTVDEWKAVLAGEKYHSSKQQAELLLRSLDGYRPYTKVHDNDVETIVRFLTARDGLSAEQKLDAKLAEMGDSIDGINGGEQSETQDQGSVG